MERQTDMVKIIHNYDGPQRTLCKYIVSRYGDLASRHSDLASRNSDLASHYGDLTKSL